MKRAALRCWVIVLALACPSWVWGQARSIQEFVAVKDRWESYVGTQWRLEGRYSVIGDRDMRFENCDLDFRLPADFQPTRWNSKVVDVRGKLEKQSGKLIFLLESISVGMDDQEQLDRRRAALKPEAPAGWDELATWARNRGTFYRDQKLLAAARDLEHQGVRVQLAAIGDRDAAALATLVEKARSLQLDEPLQQELIHEKLWAQWRQIKQQPFASAAWTELAARIGLELPGAKDVLKTWPSAIATEYQSRPRQMFQEGDAARRKLLARVFLAEVLAARWQAEGVATGENGFEIAQQLKEAVPERPDLAMLWLDRAIANRRSKVAVMSRASMQEFADQLDRVDRAGVAAEVRREWLTLQETRLADDDARGRGDLAQAWLNLLGDETQAFRLFSAAWKINRDYTPAKQWLTEHNYAPVGDLWLPANQVPVMPKSAMEVAIAEGRVLPQMTPAQVKQALGTLPDSVTRMASAKRVVELWTYNAGYVIRFEREPQQVEGRVISIQQTTQPN